ncbi:MAG TPA: sigma-70 family RNA polymerase sigma factor [Nostocaceae cyanobacterium]|nr:sigma-70 family RNA polymerase sigma factor [Nostocaceae cyanobacterium]
MNRKSYIQEKPEQKPLFCLSGLKIRNVLPEQSQIQALPQNNCWDFWRLWESYQDYFYTCCLQWMGGNSHDAEDMLSQAMLKAWNEWPKYANAIKYPKAWLTRLVHNSCMDRHRKRQREAQGIENIENIKEDHSAFAFCGEFIESDISHQEMCKYLHYRIESLPEKLRYPFLLRYSEEKSYSDIAKQLVISEENVRKRIQKARKILQKHLNKYLVGEDNTALDSNSSSLRRVTPIIEELKYNEAVTCHRESPLKTTNKTERINYKLTAICLEILPHHWYSSINLLDWR